MTGLENILLQIEAEAKKKADEITAEAEKTAGQYIDEAVLKAEEISDEYKMLSEKRARELISRAKTADEVKLNRALLLKKQEIIKTATQKAKNEIKEQKSQEYFDFLEKLLKKYALKEKGTIILAIEDKDEMPQSFKTIAAEYNLDINTGNIPARYGFILLYGGIEINCTIPAIFDAATEEISDMLNAFLFDGEGGI